MTDLKVFSVTCPNGHEARPGMTVDKLKAGYADNTLEFHCVKCDAHWKPTEKGESQRSAVAS